MKTTNFPAQDLVRRIDFANARQRDLQAWLNREWLVTNGLGGYASGTLAGALMWRYHGLLIAALPAPIGRTMMLNHLEECILLPDRRLIQFSGAEPAGPDEAKAPNYLTEFRLENQMPVWCYDVDGVRIEKRILMPYLQNTVHITFTLRSHHENLFLELRPSV